MLCLFRFFQGLIEAKGETFGAIFYNVDAITKYQEELMTVTVAGVDGTFKTVPKRPPQFTKGCLLTFQVLYKNAVSHLFKLVLIHYWWVLFNLFTIYLVFSNGLCLDIKKDSRNIQSFLQNYSEDFAQLTVITDYEQG